MMDDTNFDQDGDRFGSFCRASVARIMVSPLVLSDALADDLSPPGLPQWKHTDSWENSTVSYHGSSTDDSVVVRLRDRKSVTWQSMNRSTC